MLLLPCSGICRERTYDGEPAMKLESAASGGRVEEWDLTFPPGMVVDDCPAVPSLRTAFYQDAGRSGQAICA